MQRWFFGVMLAGTFSLLCACETSPPEPVAIIGAPAPVVPRAPNAAVSLEGLAVDAPVVGLAGAVWSDPGNSGYVTGFTYKGQYHPGAPAGYDPRTHSVVPG